MRTKSKPPKAMQPPKGLLEFQRNFGRHLRDPKPQSRLAGIPKRRSQIYEELLFNNVCGFIDRCFPVSRSMITLLRWKKLCRLFFKDWRSSDPIFAQIPFEFLRFIDQAEFKKPLPPWFAELLHYEWIELAVDMDEGAENPAQKKDNSGSICVNGTLRVLSYQWPVHKISPDYRPRKPNPFFTLVYRNIDHEIKFIEVNELTAHLVQFAQINPASEKEVLTAFAKQLGWQNNDNLISFGCNILQGLRDQQALF